ncbi:MULTISPECIES: twin-arginine translocase TatA/TatE family subunit [Sorangium]|uniref:Sec-independent protein translocase protein TatA n=1 Tax=Sorangium atrum TaxID=2995308 RepID=A0ABT5BWP4_9BACT|nr:twin-arginine translocase TatA/TatE family subunit [Sorangium aterium]MDC0678553.1 twin-arginine translocase TatA/TatE family subunit [Sorangium aterium]
MGRIGPLEIALLVGLALLLFGAGRIADVGKGIGEGIRNFKKGLRDDDEEAAKQLPAKPEEKQEDTHKPV